MFNWIDPFSDLLKATIIAAIVVLTIILTLTFAIIFKPKIKKSNYKYFYAFTAGFILIIGTLGLMGEAREGIHEHFDEHIVGIDIIITLSLFIISFILGLGIIFLIHKSTNSTDKTQLVQKNKLRAIFLILSHRVPASIVIGLLANAMPTKSALLIVIILHIIPEVLLIFYRLIDAGLSLKKAFLYSLGVKIIFFPLIILGAFIGTAIEKIWFIKPAMFIITGVLMIYASLVELVPEFINYLSSHHHGPHQKNQTQHDIIQETLEHQHQVVHISKKENRVILGVSFYLFLGIILAIMILMFHA